MRHKIFIAVISTFLLFCNAGCVDLRDPDVNPQPEGMPQKFSLYSEQAPPVEPWWQQFASEELTGLIDAGIQNNPSIEETWARLNQARATAAKAGAPLLPEVTGRVGAAHSRMEGKESAAIKNDSFDAGAFASYELDLWGRVRAGKESAALTASASSEDVSTAVISLSSQIGQAWIGLLAARQKEVRLEEQLVLNKKLLSLIETRFTTARASALDVYQQSQTVAAIEGGLITTRSQQQILLHQLALLTGRYAGAPLNLEQREFPNFEPVPAVGLPADLLARRPDVRAVGLRLQAAQWQVATARANRLPRLNLSGSFSYESSILDALFDTWLLNLAGSLAGPVFDGGERRAEVERTRAVVEERLAAYKKTVLTAIGEVEDALSREKEYRRSKENIELQLTLTEKAYREATWRYLNGLNDFLPVLREQINMITLQLDHIQAGADLLGARIELYRALGGSWAAEPPVHNLSVN